MHRWPGQVPAGRVSDTTFATIDEIYDLESDPGEQTNLAKEFPGKVTELRTLMQSIEGPVHPAVSKKK